MPTLTTDPVNQTDDLLFDGRQSPQGCAQAVRAFPRRTCSCLGVCHIYRIDPKEYFLAQPSIAPPPGYTPLASGWCPVDPPRYQDLLTRGQARCEPVPRRRYVPRIGSVFPMLFWQFSCRWQLTFRGPVLASWPAAPSFSRRLRHNGSQPCGWTAASAFPVLGQARQTQDGLINPRGLLAQFPEDLCDVHLVSISQSDRGIEAPAFWWEARNDRRPERRGHPAGASSR